MQTFAPEISCRTAFFGTIPDGLMRVFLLKLKLSFMKRKTIFVSELTSRWQRSTELCVDLKTVLHSDTFVRQGKEYRGVLRRDHDADIDDFRCRDAHFTFTETAVQSDDKRNPHVFLGQYITITRRPDGTLRPNFRPMPAGIPAERYALGVSNELIWGLEGLLEEV